MPQYLKVNSTEKIVLNINFPLSIINGFHMLLFSPPLAWTEITREAFLISASELEIFNFNSLKCTYLFMGKHHPNNIQIKCAIKLHLICYVMHNLHTLFLLN